MKTWVSESNESDIFPWQKEANLLRGEGGEFNFYVQLKKEVW